jgi:uncharacterized damage-inducible protein DinB
MLDTTTFQIGPTDEVPAVDKEILIKLFNDHYRANHRLWRAVMALSHEQFSQAPGDGSPSVQTQVVRMVANENLWVNYLWHGEVEFLQESQIPTRASIRVEWDALEEEMRDFIDELSPAELERQVRPTFLNTDASLKVGEILLQIVNSAVECRAQLRLHLHRLGTPMLEHDFFDSVFEQNSPTYDRISVWPNAS